MLSPASRLHRECGRSITIHVALSTSFCFGIASFVSFAFTNHRCVTIKLGPGKVEGWLNFPRPIPVSILRAKMVAETERTERSDQEHAHRWVQSRDKSAQ